MDLTKYHYYTDDKGHIHSVDLATGEDTIASVQSAGVTYHPMRFNKSIAIKICELVREGHAITDIAAMPDMPAAGTIYQWARAIEDFQLQLEYAREDRAHHFHDAVLKEAKELDDPSMVNVVKTRIDAYKWAAEKANKRYYGKEKEEQIAGNTTIIISTGIPTEPTTVEASCKTVSEAD